MKKYLSLIFILLFTLTVKAADVPVGNSSASLSGKTLLTTADVGTASARNAEDTMTNGSNLPDGAAVIAYLVANYQINLHGLYGEDDDDCTGQQGQFWWDSTDSRWEFCDANSGVPVNVPNQSVDSAANPSHNTLNLVGTNSLNLGTSSSATGQIVFKNSTNANTVTRQSGTTSTSYTITEATAAPAGNAYLVHRNTDGTEGYTDPSTLGGGSGDGGGVQKDTNCNQAKYFPLGTLCQDTDDGKLYKGTGAAVEEIGTASVSIDSSPSDGDNTDGISSGWAYTLLNTTLPATYHPLWDYDYTDLINKPTIVALGETSADAYRGDRGKIAYDHSQAAHAPANAEQNVQSDWSQADSGADDFVKNKPTIDGQGTAGQVVIDDGDGTLSAIGYVPEGILWNEAPTDSDLIKGKAYWVSILDYDPSSLLETISADTIAFVEGGESADTITDSGSGFVTAGFEAGMRIEVSGTTSNNGTYTIATVTEEIITLIPSDDLTDESAGSSITINGGFNYAVRYNGTNFVTLFDEMGTLLLTAESTLGVLGLTDPEADNFPRWNNTTDTWQWSEGTEDGSMVYPSGSGIPIVVSGTSWGTTITNNSANWNKALLNDGTDNVNDLHIDWGIGTNEVNAEDIPILDTNSYFAAANIEAALKELWEKRGYIAYGDTLPGTCTIGDSYWDTDADIDGSLYVCRATDTWKEVDDDGGAGGMATTDIDTSSELATIVTDETGASSGTPLLVFNQAPRIDDIELGAATDTTIHRESAGVVSIEGIIISRTIASGTAALGTNAISSGACASAVTETATGTATTDIIGWGFNGDPTSTTGYSASADGMLTIISYPSSNNVNFKVCNNTASSVTPGAITLNWKVIR